MKEKRENKRHRKGSVPKTMKPEKNYVLRNKIFTVLTQVFHSLTAILESFLQPGVIGCVFAIFLFSNIFK